MAGGVNGIATRADANGVKSGSYTTDLKRCITYASAISVGLGVSNASTYTSNQLVKYSDLYAPIELLVFWFTIDISSDANLYNNGPITLNAAGLIKEDFTPISYAREVEATEVEQDTSGIPLEYSNTHVEEQEETAMALSTVDEVLQVAQEFEEQDLILRAAALLSIGVTLTKDDSSTNLLDSSTYGPVGVSNKKVTFRLYSTTYSSSAAGTYKLSFGGSRLLKNNGGLYPSGGIYASSSSTNQYKTITVSSAGTYTFNAYWKKTTTPDPSIPTPTTYKVRVRIQLVDILVYSFRVGIGDWTIYGSAGIELGSGSFPPTEYRPEQLPCDIDTTQLVPGGGNWYVIEIWSGTTRPVYIDPGMISFSHRASSMDYWNAGFYTIVNDMNIYYGYGLNQGYSTTVYNFDLRCSGARW